MTPNSVWTEEKEDSSLKFYIRNFEPAGPNLYALTLQVLSSKNHWMKSGEIINYFGSLGYLTTMFETKEWKIDAKSVCRACAESHYSVLTGLNEICRSCK